MELVSHVRQFCNTGEKIQKEHGWIPFTSVDIIRETLILQSHTKESLSTAMKFVVYESVSLTLFSETLLFQEFAIRLDQQLSYCSLNIPFDLDITDSMGLLPSQQNKTDPENFSEEEQLCVWKVVAGMDSYGLVPEICMPLLYLS